ncbi:DUF1642 domain-containing protein [Listeria booriae]|uniref:DUF1642 domain-containing protein n=1 Tax=Listeria booriae TaxID=1552123 RepID=A0A842D402_9LIST|nr:DUF1642 domain-containing protein [Listeria booriae]MBC2004657.1 DUF1642 domain-containing protein [Listeria booriae]
MTQKFKVGDRVRVVDNQKITIGKIDVITNYDERCRIITNNEIFWTDIKCLAPAPALVKVPAVVDKFLKTDADGYTIYDRMAQLIVVNDGDHYYLEESAVENEVLSREEALEVINYAHEAKCEDLLQLINGYEVEKEPLYYVRLPHFGYVTNRMDYTLSQSKTDAIALTESRIKAIDERYWQFAVPEEGK